MGDELQRRYLDAMGIQRWVARSSRAACPIGETTVRAEAETADQPDASEWDSLQAEVIACTRCELHKTRTQTVFGTGNRQADWLIVGEAPGADEDREGEPFVGRAGELLNEMLFATGHRREQVYIANILKCRPPGNRNPQSHEISCCVDYLWRQIRMVQPKIILAVGGIAANSLLQTDARVGELRGKVHYVAEQTVVVTYHPAYLLRSPLEKRKVWDDLQFARKVYRGVAH